MARTLFQIDLTDHVELSIEFDPWAWSIGFYRVQTFNDYIVEKEYTECYVCLVPMLPVRLYWMTLAGGASSRGWRRGPKPAGGS